jgi:DnaJ-class molecular chaperone
MKTSPQESRKVKDNEPCPLCMGKKYVYDDNKEKEVCSACKGSGLFITQQDEVIKTLLGEPKEIEIIMKE